MEKKLLVTDLDNGGDWTMFRCKNCARHPVLFMYFRPPRDGINVICKSCKTIWIIDPE